MDENKETSFNISSLISKDRVIFIDKTVKLDALEKLAKASFKMTNDPETFKKALFEREKIISTGMGYGIAFPHVKIDAISEFFITVGISEKGVDWDAFDQMPVHIICLIGGPDNSHNNYLRILAKLSLILRNPENREKLKSCRDAACVADFMSKF